MAGRAKDEKFCAIAKNVISITALKIYIDRRKFDVFNPLPAEVRFD
jgi:hypothetical protein